MTQAYVPGDGYCRLGAIRYEIEWVTIKPSARGKGDIDPDFDTVPYVDYRPDKEAAMKRGAEIFEQEKGNLCWGVVTVCRQIVEWVCEEDNIADWSSTDDCEEIC